MYCFIHFNIFFFFFYILLKYISEPALSHYYLGKAVEFVLLLLSEYYTQVYVLLLKYTMWIHLPPPLAEEDAEGLHRIPTSFTATDETTREQLRTLLATVYHVRENLPE